MSSMVVSWMLWAKSVPDVTQTQRVLLCELAALADAEGVALAEIKHLVQVVNRHRSVVFRALGELEKKGLVVREERKDERGGTLPSYFQLRSGGALDVARARTLISSHSKTSPAALRADSVPPIPDGHGQELLDQVRLLCESDSASTRQTQQLFADILAAVLEHSWSRQTYEAVGILLDRQAPLRFRKAINTAQSLGYPLNEARTEVTTLAWQIVYNQTQALAEAKTPWGYLARAVEHSISSSLLISEEQAMDKDALSIAVEHCPVVEDFTDEAVVTLRALGERQTNVIRAMVDRGMSETVATAVTLRLTEIAVSNDISRRTSTASRDHRLADWGVCPQAAALWMKAVAPTRAKKEKTLEELADGIIDLIQPYSSVA